jgi:hypothetical protein
MAALCSPFSVPLYTSDNMVPCCTNSAINTHFMLYMLSGKQCSFKMFRLIRLMRVYPLFWPSFSSVSSRYSYDDSDIFRHICCIDLEKSKPKQYLHFARNHKHFRGPWCKKTCERPTCDTRSGQRATFVGIHMNVEKLWRTTSVIVNISLPIFEHCTHTVLRFLNSIHF